MSALPPEFVALLRSPGFEERVKAELQGQMTVNFSNIPGTEYFVMPTGVWAQPGCDNDEWWLDLRRDNRLFVPFFIVIFPLLFGGFFWLVGGRATGLIVGALALMGSSAFAYTINGEPELKRPVAIRGTRWVWNGKDVDMAGFVGLVVLNAELKEYRSCYQCLVGIGSDGSTTLLNQYAGSPLIRLTCMAGYPVADGRFGFENPASWPDWA